MDNISLKIENYKCFKTKQGFEEIKRVNVLIGKNNSGKSSLLDLISETTQKVFSISNNTRNGHSKPIIYFKREISSESITKSFSANTSGGKIGCNHGIYGHKFQGVEMEWATIDNKSYQLIDIRDEHITPRLQDSGDNHYLNNLMINNISQNIFGKTFKRLTSDRDVIPEANNKSNIKVNSNGSGATNIIQRFINSSDLPSSLVKKDLLIALNSIFTPDAYFTDIICQEHENGNWEIYLEEENKGEIPLSKSGSGLKTVILSIVFTLLIPEIEKKSLDNYIYAFEELENNMHPSLLRRLIKYLDDLSFEHQFPILITTHSSALIDYFSKKDDAQIVHISHKNGESFCRTVNRHIENFHILDDLGIKASDLLQANGVIWVEGASDVVYIKKWLEMYVEENNISEKPIQGRHYEFQMYGGTLLDSLCLIKNNSDE